MEVKLIDPNCRNHYLTRQCAKGPQKRTVQLPEDCYLGREVEATEVEAGRNYQLLITPASHYQCDSDAWTFEILDIFDGDDECESHSGREGYLPHKVTIWRDNLALTAEGPDEKMIMEGGDRDDLWLCVRRAPRQCPKCDVLFLKVTYFGHDATEDTVLPLYISGKYYCMCDVCAYGGGSDFETPETSDDEEIEVDKDEPVQKKVKTDLEFVDVDDDDNAISV